MDRYDHQERWFKGLHEQAMALRPRPLNQKPLNRSPLKSSPKAHHSPARSPQPARSESPQPSPLRPSPLSRRPGAGHDDSPSRAPKIIPKFVATPTTGKAAALAKEFADGFGVWTFPLKTPTEELEIIVADPAYKIKVYCFGAKSKRDVLLCIPGGPGLACDYIRDTHSWIHEKMQTLRIVFYDPLGCGSSECPRGSQAMWNLERFADEVEHIRRALLGSNMDRRFHLYAHGTGTWIAQEYLLTYQDTLSSLTLCDGAGDIPHFRRVVQALRDDSGLDVSMMRHHEAAGTLGHPEYQAALMLLDCMHFCRVPRWPDLVLESLREINEEIRDTMTGPNVYTISGNTKDWCRLNELHILRCPVLIMCGEHGYAGPPCSQRLVDSLPRSYTDRVCVKVRTRFKIFKESSMHAFLEEPGLYFEELLSFLDTACRLQ